MAQAASDRRNLRRTDYARRIFCIRRSADPLFGSADNSARNHTCGIPGVFLGCLISNILGGAILPDIIFGSIATLIGALFTLAASQ